MHEPKVYPRKYRDIIIVYKGVPYSGYYDTDGTWRIFNSPNGINDTWITDDEVDDWTYA